MNWFDRDGNPIDRDQWMLLMGDDEYRRIARGTLDTDIDELAGDPGTSVAVSTVWLGIDHSFGRGTPLVFETKIFGGPYDQEMVRYTTMDQALDGHRQVMEDLADNRVPWWLAQSHRQVYGETMSDPPERLGS